MAEAVGRPVRLAAELVHFVEVEQPLDGVARQVLDRLLQYGPAAHPAEPQGGLLLVVPRPGTISPWSKPDKVAALGSEYTRLEREMQALVDEWAEAAG